MIKGLITQKIYFAMTFLGIFLNLGGVSLLMGRELPEKAQTGWSKLVDRDRAEPEAPVFGEYERLAQVNLR